ncbi:hypothetical protein [Advenella mimigardefordensis]|nr:hypothetical protein [Advenella mimigardefordensis]
MMEFLVVALPLLLAAVTSYEASRWYMVREAVNLALLQAGRAGSVNHTRPQAIEDAFLEALAPLYAPAGAYRSPQERMQHQLQRFEQDSGQLAWDITITHPNLAEFADFMQKDLPIAIKTGHPAINNNYQHRQHQQYPRGTASGSTIYDANTLQLQARYLYEPVVPGMKSLLRTIFGAIGAPESPQARLGALPMSAAITIEMQSHPVLWLTEETTHVRYQQRNTLARSSATRRTPPDPGRSQGSDNHSSTKGGMSTETAPQPATVSATSPGDRPVSPVDSETGTDSGQPTPSRPVANNDVPENALPTDAACLP